MPTVAPAAVPATPAAPVALRRGDFTRIDAVHWAEGAGTIYRLPDLELDAFHSVVIYCTPFSVVFSTMELRPVEHEPAQS